MLEDFFGVLKFVYFIVFSSDNVLVWMGFLVWYWCIWFDFEKVLLVLYWYVWGVDGLFFY